MNETIKKTWLVLLYAFLKITVSSYWFLWYFTKLFNPEGLEIPANKTKWKYSYLPSGNFRSIGVYTAISFNIIKILKAYLSIFFLSFLWMKLGHHQACFLKSQFLYHSFFRMNLFKATRFLVYFLSMVYVITKLFKQMGQKFGQWPPLNQTETYPAIHTRSCVLLGYSFIKFPSAIHDHICLTLRCIKSH